MLLALKGLFLRAFSSGKKYISKFSKLCFSRGSCGHIDLFQDKKQFLSFLNFVSKGFSGLSCQLGTVFFIIRLAFRPGLQKGHTQKTNSWVDPLIRPSGRGRR